MPSRILAYYLVRLYDGPELDRIVHKAVTEDGWHTIGERYMDHEMVCQALVQYDKTRIRPSP